MPEWAARTRSRAGRRRLVATALLAVPASAALALLPASAQEAGPSTRCTITDPRLPEISGLVSAGETLLAMNDGGERVEVYVLDADCAVAEVRSADVDPYDPEDLALAADGTLWLADIGDNNAVRETVALIGLRPDGSTTLTRLTYPDGAHDAEALLLAPDGTPYLVTKEVLGSSGVYRPDAPLADGATVPMTRVMGLGFTLTGTPGGPVGRAGQLLVTGGAVSADGQRIALRTYTDAYVWPLTGSDVPGALSGPPVRIALPESPQGEAITFAANDRDLLVTTEGLPAPVTLVPVPEVPVPGAPAPGAPPGAPLTAPSTGELATAARGVPPVTAGIIAAGVATVFVWVAGKVRRRRE